jgi:hypothetical protein
MNNDAFVKNVALRLFDVLFNRAGTDAQSAPDLAVTVDKYP